MKKYILLFLVLSFGVPQYASAQKWPRITIKKNKYKFKKPKITIKKEKFKFKKIKIKADVVGDLKNPTRIFGNVVKIVVKDLPGGDVIVEVTENVLVKPTDAIVKETDIFINNVGKELERGWDNGTIQTIAIAVASYYIAGPIAFELIGWEQIAGAVVIDLVVSEVSNIDTKTSDLSEKLIMDVIEKSNKTITPVIENLKNYLCEISGSDKDNCSFNYVLKAEIDDELLIGMDNDLKSHYNYYKKTYDNSTEFIQNIKKHRKNYLKNYNLTVSKRVVDPILSKMLESSKQYFTTMTYSADLISQGKFSDIELHNLMEIFNDASINFYATNYILSHESLVVEQIENPRVKNILSQWTLKKDNIDYLHYDLLDNYINVQSEKDIARSPSSLRLITLSGVFVGATILGNIYHATNHIEHIQYYRELINSDIKTMAKYKYLDNTLQRMQINTALLMTKENIEQLPNLINVYGKISQGKKIFQKNDFFELMDSLNVIKLKDEINKFNDLINNTDLNKPE